MALSLLRLGHVLRVRSESTVPEILEKSVSVWQLGTKLRRVNIAGIISKNRFIERKIGAREFLIGSQIEISDE